MRAVIQRVSEAGVMVDGEAERRIDRGLLVYVGMTHNDGPAEVSTLADKIRHLRIFPDEAGKMNLDVVQAGGAVMIVSNFTLYADTRKGRRPAFVAAAGPDAASALYEQLCDAVRQKGVRVEQGWFGRLMSVRAVNSGPINLVIDTAGGL